MFVYLPLHISLECVSEVSELFWRFLVAGFVVNVHDAFQNIFLAAVWSIIVVIVSQGLLVQISSQPGCCVLHLLCISATAHLSLLFKWFTVVLVHYLCLYLMAGRYVSTSVMLAFAYLTLWVHDF